MRFTGTIIDYLTGEVLPGASITLVNAKGESLGTGTVANNEGQFTLSVATGTGNEILFSNVGYTSLIIPVSEISEGDDLNVQLAPAYKEGENVTVYSKRKAGWLVALGLLGLAVISDKKGKRKRTVSGVSALQKVNPNTVLIIAGGIAAVVVGKKLLVSLGLTDGPGAENVSKEYNNPNSPWKPEFWKSGPSNELLLSEDEATAMAAVLFFAMGTFSDDFNSIVQVFNKLRTKSQLSYLSDVFTKRNQKDLLTWLTKGEGNLPWNGLSDSELKRLTDLVNNLPNYQP